MNREKDKKNSKTIWLLALVLFICVAATTVCVMEILDDYLMDDSDAIGLVPEGTDGLSEEELVPGFQISSDGKTWGTTTEIILFHVSYENGERQVTVESEDGEKVIAPGTENSFVFKLKNTGEVPLDFNLYVETKFEPEEFVADLDGRLSRYDGKWILGDNNKFDDLEEKSEITDITSLGVGRYAYYTLDWKWPFEDGNDEWDTKLGNQAVTTEITFTITINTTATISEDADCQKGLLPKTGDTRDILLWAIIGAGALLGIIFVLVKRDKDEDEPSEEEDDSSDEK